MSSNRGDPPVAWKDLTPYRPATPFWKRFEALERARDGAPTPLATWNQPALCYGTRQRQTISSPVPTFSVGDLEGGAVFQAQAALGESRGRNVGVPKLLLEAVIAGEASGLCGKFPGPEPSPRGDAEADHPAMSDAAPPPPKLPVEITELPILDALVILRQVPRSRQNLMTSPEENPADWVRMVKNNQQNGCCR